MSENEMINIEKKAELSAANSLGGIENIPRKETVIFSDDSVNKKEIRDRHAKNCAYQIVSYSKKDTENLVTIYGEFLKGTVKSSSIFYKGVKLSTNTAIEQELETARKYPHLLYVRYFNAIMQYVARFVEDKSDIVENKKTFVESVKLYMEEFLIDQT
jgi:hypothetical protein